MSLSMTDKDVRVFASNNQDAMLILRIGVHDYTASRCCILNGLFSGFSIVAQAVEKILKSFLYLHKYSKPREFSHHLVKAANKIQEYNDYGLDKYKPLLEKLEKHYQTRYHDNANRSKGLYGEEIHEFDELIMHLMKVLPVPDEVKFRTGIYGELFDYDQGLVSLSGSSSAHWLIYNNKALSHQLIYLQQRCQEVMDHLYNTSEKQN
jgi:HEPN domain-containing protein